MMSHAQLVVSPPVISSSIFIMTLRMLSSLCQGAGCLAEQLMRQSEGGTIWDG